MKRELKWIVSGVGVDYGGYWSGLWGMLEWSVGGVGVVVGCWRGFGGLLYTRAHTHCQERENKKQSAQAKGREKERYKDKQRA